MSMPVNSTRTVRKSLEAKLLAIAHGQPRRSTIAQTQQVMSTEPTALRITV